jgi:hypothetical protein
MVIKTKKHHVGEKHHCFCPMALVTPLHPIFWCTTNIIVVPTTPLDEIDNQYRYNVVA